MTAMVDWESLMENFDNDKFAISMVVEAFLESASESLEAVRKAIATDDLKQIAMASHSLKGAMSNFGAKDAVQTAQALENHGYGEKSENLNNLFEKLELEVIALVRELNHESHRYRE